MDISGISKNLNNYITNNSMASNDQVKFEELLRKSVDEQKDGELKEACQQFESYYLKQLFSEMRKTVPKSELLQAATGRDTYEDMIYEEYANEISKGNGAGIAKMLYKQLSQDVKK